MLFFLFALLGAFAYGQGSKEENTMKYYPDIFSSVPVNTSEINACSPKDPGVDWLGLVIRAPLKIEIAAEDADKAVVPLCGFYQVEMTDALKSPSPRIYVKNTDSGHIYEGGLLDRDENPQEPLPLPEEPLDPADLKDMLLGSWFNPDLTDYVSFPVTSAVYEIYVEYAGMQSNKVRVELTVQ
ncbi:MAG: hypothetical protein CSA76_04260 [Spirochaetales bacterium]|nr:MAG: hypothetical protein CSA76_04260 [Spirochaetales bacterium]